MNTNGLLVTSGFLASGAVAGHCARRLLTRLRRGAVFRPPGCELFAAMASAIVGWRVAGGALPVWWCAVPLLLGWLAVPLAAVDLVALRLPNALTYAAYPILGSALAVAAVYGPDHAMVIRALLGAAAFGGAHALVRCFTPTSLGAGDVKLAGSLGAVLAALGWQFLLTASALAAIVTLLLALIPTPHRARAAPQPQEAPRTEPPRPVPRTGRAATQSTAPTPAQLTESPGESASESLAESPKAVSPAGPGIASATPGRGRVPLLRRAVPHGPGLLAATWLLATFPGQAVIGGVIS